MTITDDILTHLERARAHLYDATALLQPPTPTPTPTAPEIVVAPGDNLPSLVEIHPPGTVFALHPDFHQDVGVWVIGKPCVIRSDGLGRLEGALTAVAPDVRFIALRIDGDGGTILTTGLRTRVDICTLNGHANGQHRGIAVNSAGVRILRTSVLNIAKDIDTQAIAGWNGTRDLEVADCDLEASGENVMFGGGDSDSEAMMARDIRIRRCRMSKRQEWRADPRVTCKNLFELKAVDGLLLEDCELEYSFVDGQVGFGLVLTVRNQDGAMPWATIANVLITRNVIRHVAGGVSILGRDYTHPSGVMHDVTFRANRYEDIDPAQWGWNGREWAISGGPRNLRFEGETFSGRNLGGLYFDQPQHRLDGFSVTNSQFVEGEYGIVGTDAPALGLTALAMYAPDYVWDNNRVQRSGHRHIDWPAGTTFV